MDFGEVRMESSRAFWDDYDEISEERDEISNLEWVWQNEENTAHFPAQLDTLLIVEGFSVNVLDLFNTILFKNRSPVCFLKIGQASVYNFPESKLSVAMVDEKDLNYFTLITKALQPWIDVAKNIYAITFNTTASYKGEQTVETVDGCFIRGINSTLDYIEELQVPNIITGVSAGIISYCKFQNKPATCFISYMETPVFDSVTTKPLIRVLRDLKIPCEDSYTYKHKNVTSLYL